MFRDTFLLICDVFTFFIAVWLSEIHMSRDGLSYFLYKDQEIKATQGNRSNDFHFCASASQKYLKYHGISGLLCHLTRPAHNLLLLEILFHYLTIVLFSQCLEWNRASDSLSKLPVFPLFYFSYRSTVCSVYILGDLASLWIEKMEKMNHCLKQIRCQT